MKKKIIISMFTIFLISSCINQVFAKYVLEESIVVANVRIDRTSPNIQIKYSTKEVTTGKVEVTIEADEEIQSVEGFNLQKDKKTLKKEYDKNTKEEIQIKDLAGNIKTVTIEVNNIDKEIPTIEIKKVTNSNTEYPSYANKDAKISFDIIIKDDRKVTKILEGKDIKVLIDGEVVEPKEKNITVKKDTNTEKNVVLTITGIEKEGNLSLKIEKGAIKDELNNNSLEIEKDTKIQIDNTKPQAIYSQTKIEGGKVEAIITADEKIRKLEGWNIEKNTILKKVFTNNISYTTNVCDFAGNIAEIEINIKEASNVILSYASHNSMVGWSYGYGNYDIAGLEALKKDPIYKTESLAFSISGDIEKDYLQARAYVYTHWGEGSRAKCKTTRKIYSYGWNPSKTGWKYENDDTRVKLNGRNYFQLGGAGVSAEHNTDINGNGKITLETALEFRYGISALELKLKSYEENSICYQIYVDSVRLVKTS